MQKRSFQTKAIRNQARLSSFREHSTPIYLTSSFSFQSAEQGKRIFDGVENGNLYSRFSNPNTNEFIETLCLLEKCESGIATASGMAAVYTSLVSFLSYGDHIVVSKNSFGNTLYIVTSILPKMGVEYTLVELDDNEAWKSAIQTNTKLLYLETPSNPLLKVADLAFIGNLCKENNIISIVDNCFATPYLQNPSNFGIDIIVHSATKYIDGQGRVLGGAILGPESLIQYCYDFIRKTGACLSPFNAWILSKSLETLAIRMERHSSNALAIAKELQNCKYVRRVVYPHLKSHSHFLLAKKQMRSGGGIVSFELDFEEKKIFKFLNALELFTLTANLGDSRSIATHPQSTTHSKLSPQEQKNAGISPQLIRLSIGLEEVGDLIADIVNALNKIK